MYHGGKRLPEYQLIPISPQVSPIMQRAAAVFGNVILWYVETKRRTSSYSVLKLVPLQHLL